jgi:cadmium resistance protein CadD (predicted permease)
LVAFGTVVIVVLSVGAAIVKARYVPAGHSVDLTPLGPILLGIVALALLWVGAFVAWLVGTLRKSPKEQEGSPRSFG